MVDDMEKRITNLEIALHYLWGLLKDLQPPATQEYVSKMMEDHFKKSVSLGGFSRTFFESK